MSTKKPVSEKISTKNSHEIPKKSHEIQYESLEIPLESFEIPEKSPEIQYESLEIPCKSHILSDLMRFTLNLIHSESHVIHSESHEIQSESHEIHSESHVIHSESHEIQRESHEIQHKSFEISERSPEIQSFNRYRDNPLHEAPNKIGSNQSESHKIQVESHEIQSESHEIPFESHEIQSESLVVQMMLVMLGYTRYDEGGDVKVPEYDDESARRARMAPWRVFVGLGIFFMTILTAETGISMKFHFLNLQRGKEKDLNSTIFLSFKSESEPQVIEYRHLAGYNKSVIKFGTYALRITSSLCFRRTKAEPPIYYSIAKQPEKEDPISLEERKKLRVKVYRLNGEGTWDDQGTRHVTIMET
ncbi:hypothetical protein Tco_0503481 [Tanacetum coccineum]